MQKSTEKKRLISPVWTLPLVALALAIWLLIQSWFEAGQQITIAFKNVNGILPGKTKVLYQGIAIGSVKSVHLNQKLDGILVDIEMIRSATPLLKENTLFWLVSPKASLTEISGLDALVSGNYIAMRPGDGETANEFVAVDTEPASALEQGLAITLVANNVHSINVGSPILFNKFQVGEVKRQQLNENKQIQISALIYANFAHLVKTQTRFWHSSGINANISLKGLELNTQSISSLINGSISFDSPSDSPPAAAANVFTLYETQKAARRGQYISISFSTLNGINASNTKLRYQGLEVGHVSDISLSPSAKIEAFVYQEYLPLFTQNSSLYLQQPEISFSGIKHLGALLGSDIIVIPQAGEPSTVFSLSERKPLPPNSLRLSLTSDQLHGITAKSEIHYLGFKIGEVLNISLEQEKLLIDVYIEAKYRKQITEDAVFYVQTPFELEASLDKLHIESGGIKSFISSPIHLITGNKPMNTDSALKYVIYDGLDSALDAQSLTSSKNHTINLQAHSLGSVQVGSLISYKGLVIGKVVQHTLNKDGLLDVQAEIEPTYTHLVTPHSRFWQSPAVSLQFAARALNVNVPTLKQFALGNINMDNFPQLAAERDKRLYESFDDALARYVEIKLTAKQADGLNDNMPIRYQGQQIGKVTHVKFTDTLEQVTLKARIDHPYTRDFVREGARFLLETPLISLSKVRNVQNIVTGNFIRALPGKGKPHTQFMLTEARPALASEQATVIFVEALSLNAISENSPLFYKQHPVGRVVNTRLKPDGSGVIAKVAIDKIYAHFLRENSIFWDNSGIAFDLGFSGAHLRADTLHSIMLGGLSFATPEESRKMGGEVKSGHHYKLTTTFDKNWLEWAPSLTSHSNEAPCCNTP